RPDHRLRAVQPPARDTDRRGGGRGASGATGSARRGRDARAPAARRCARACCGSGAQDPGCGASPRRPVDALRDEPLLAALPASHRHANAEAISLGAFAGERVLLPREPAGQAFNAWLRAVVRAAGFELERTLETLSAPWDRRMLPVSDREAVSLFS